MIMRLCLLAMLASTEASNLALGIDLREAAGAGNTKEVVLLLEQGASANAGGDLKDDAGETPLHLACIGGDAQLVTALLSSGATVDARATGPKSLRMTPLTWCAYGGHDDAVEVLLTEGKADPNLVVDDEQGNKLTALDIALRVGDSLGGRHIRTRVLLEHAGGKKAAELS